MKKYLLLCLAFVSMLSAQTNLISNGGFEIYKRDKPINWHFSDYLYYEKTTDAHSGNYAIKMWANGGYLSIIDNSYNRNVIPVETNTEYELSYWYKGNITKSDGTPMKYLPLTITWFKGKDQIKKEYLKDHRITATENWQQKKITLKTPPGVDRMGITFMVELANTGYIILDDVSMIFTKKSSEDLPVPTSFSARPYQREIDFSWDKEADAEIQWELIFNNQPPLRLTTPYYTFDNLEPNQAYKAKLRAVKGTEASKYIELNVSTREMNYRIDSPERVPHLRTLGEDGTASRILPLYFNDLADTNARITYFIEGQEVSTKDNRLYFPKTGKQKLKVNIEESPDRQWELEYNVNIRD